MADTHPSPRGHPRPYPAEKARQSEIVLKSTWQRVVFIGGLVSFMVFALALAFLR
jgi:hypothetical protein